MEAFNSFIVQILQIFQKFVNITLKQWFYHFNTDVLHQKHETINQDPPDAP